MKPLFANRKTIFKGTVRCLQLAMIGISIVFLAGCDSGNQAPDADNEYGAVVVATNASSSSMQVTVGTDLVVVMVVTSTNAVSAYSWQELNSSNNTYQTVANTTQELTFPNAQVSQSGTYRAVAAVYNQSKTSTRNYYSNPIAIQVVTAPGSSTPTPTPAPTPTPTPTPTPAPTSSLNFTGLHVVMGTSGGAAGYIANGSGQAVHIHGADETGTEYGCAQDVSIFMPGAPNVGPESPQSISAMKSWNINAIRVPLNEACWLGISGSPAAFSGQNYISAIQGYVNSLTAAGIMVILDLHYGAPGSLLDGANGIIEPSMPNTDHGLAFWTSVATTFASKGSGDSSINSMVMFDLLNEPYSNSFPATSSDWNCWLKGGCSISIQGLSGSVGTALGMADIFKAVRSTGAQNIILMGGLSFACDLSKWATQVAQITSLSGFTGPLNIAASWHIYDGPLNSAGSTVPSDTFNASDISSGVLNQGYPLVVGEIGTLTGATTWFQNMLPALDQLGIGYLAWSWSMEDGGYLNLITDYATGTASANGIGNAYQAHLKTLGP